MRKFTVRDLTFAAAVAALYAVLGYFGDIFGLTFGAVQFRFAEALTVLPALADIFRTTILALCNRLLFHNACSFLRHIANTAYRKELRKSRERSCSKRRKTEGVMLPTVFPAPHAAVPQTAPDEN